MERRTESDRDMAFLGGFVYIYIVCRKVCVFVCNLRRLDACICSSLRGEERVFRAEINDVERFYPKK